MWGPKEEKVRKPRVLRLYCKIFSMLKSVAYETKCRHVGVHRGKHEQSSLYSTETHATSVSTSFILKWEASTVCCFFFLLFLERCRVVVTGCHENESCSKILDFLERLDDIIRLPKRKQLQ